MKSRNNWPVGGAPSAPSRSANTQSSEGVKTWIYLTIHLNEHLSFLKRFAQMYEHYYVLAQYVLSSVSQVKYWDPALTVHDNTGNWAVSPRLACSDYVIFYCFISWFPSFDFISIFVLLFCQFLILFVNGKCDGVGGRVVDVPFSELKPKIKISKFLLHISHLKQNIFVNYNKYFGYSLK